MPLVRTNTGGASIYASARVSNRVIITVAAGASSNATDAELMVMNLPHAFWWVLPTAGPVGMTFTPQIAVVNTPLGPGVAPLYQPLTTPQLLVLGAPTLFFARTAANMISLSLTVPAGPFGATFVVDLAASL